MLTGNPNDRLTASAGVTDARPTDAANDLMARADKALYRAKDHGRGRVDVE